MEVIVIIAEGAGVYKVLGVTVSGEEGNHDSISVMAHWGPVLRHLVINMHELCDLAVTSFFFILTARELRVNQLIYPFYLRAVRFVHANPPFKEFVNHRVVNKEKWVIGRGGYSRQGAIEKGMDLHQHKD